MSVSTQVLNFQVLEQYLLSSENKDPIINYLKVIKIASTISIFLPDQLHMVQGKELFCLQR